jgi:hypothetical protein
MPTRELLAPSQRAQFTELPAILDDRTLARFYTLSDDELRLIHRHRRASTQLGFAVQLGYARFPGRPLRVGEDAHPQIVAVLAGQLGVDPAAFSDYLHGRDTTRREHLLEIQRDFGFRPFSASIYRELAGWLLPIALTTDVGTVLMGALIDEIRERKILAPALSTIERLAWETRLPHGGRCGGAHQLRLCVGQELGEQRRLGASSSAARSDSSTVQPSAVLVADNLPSPIQRRTVRSDVRARSAATRTDRLAMRPR